MIKQINGEHQIEDYIAPASTEFDFDDVVTLNSSGQLAKAVQTTPRSELIGLIQTVIASTDDDYASTKVVGVNEFHKEAEYEADVDTGTLATTMVRDMYDIADENGIDVTVSVQKHVKIVRYISSSKARVKFITDGNKMELKSCQQVVALADFTDGGSTAGTLVMDDTIPAGAVFERTLVTGITGFAGDTTAVLTVGDGSDVDRYNTGTPSVFTTATAGVSMGAGSGTLWHTAGITPTLTVTGGADFSSITAGAFTITLFWYEVA